MTQFTTYTGTRHCCSTAQPSAFMVEVLSLEELEQRARAGDGASANLLGDRYRMGEDGVQVDHAAAFNWYKHGAELGDPSAQNNLGTMFLEGVGCSVDIAEAIDCYRKSAEQGLMAAQWNFAKRYLHGDGTEVNYAEAYQWFEKAAAQGCTDASCEMGTMYRNGQGVDRNLLTAAEFHVMAAESGDPVALGHLSDYKEQLQDMALSGNPRASCILSSMYNRGLGVERSQSLTWTWILCATKDCENDTHAANANDVQEVYELRRKDIGSIHRNEGKRILAKLRAAHTNRMVPRLPQAPEATSSSEYIQRVPIRNTTGQESTATIMPWKGQIPTGAHRLDPAKLLKAIAFAAEKHTTQRRKDAAASPYINHPIAVATVLATEGDVSDDVTLLAAVLHDTVEDTETTIAELEQHFGAKVASVVNEVTDEKLDQNQRKQLQILHAAHSSSCAKQVKIADKICNIRDIMTSPPVDWPLERRIQYLVWSEEVVAGCRLVNATLDQAFDQVITKARELLQSNSAIQGTPKE